MRPRFMWSFYLAIKGVALLAMSAVTSDTVGLWPGILSLCAIAIIAPLEAACVT